VKDSIRSGKFIENDSCCRHRTRSMMRVEHVFVTKGGGKCGARSGWTIFVMRNWS
jgi:hypothetical protein